jgi:N6-adenosine-specific RNA methylase IME4
VGQTTDTTGYRCIVADPPWPQAGGGTLRGREGWHDSHGASRPMPYGLMSVAEIAAMPVAELAHEDGAHLYLWTTNGFLADAFDVVRAWGFRYSTTLVWAKAPMGGGLGGAFGISTEYIVYARRGQLAPLSRVRGTWFPWLRPYDERGKPMHSAKPDEFYRLAEIVTPGPRVELFARRRRRGWDAWGNQAPGAVTLEPLADIAEAALPAPRPAAEDAQAGLFDLIR